MGQTNRLLNLQSGARSIRGGLASPPTQASPSAAAACAISKLLTFSLLRSSLTFVTHKPQSRCTQLARVYVRVFVRLSAHAPTDCRVSLQSVCRCSAHFAFHAPRSRGPHFSTAYRPGNSLRRGAMTTVVATFNERECAEF